jgi:hypothetical protein
VAFAVNLAILRLAIKEAPVVVLALVLALDQRALVKSGKKK